MDEFAFVLCGDCIHICDDVSDGVRSITCRYLAVGGDLVLRIIATETEMQYCVA